MNLNMCYRLIKESSIENKEDVFFELGNHFLPERVDGALSQYNKSQSKWGFEADEMIDIINDNIEDDYEVGDDFRVWLKYYESLEALRTKMLKIEYP